VERQEWGEGVRAAGPTPLGSYLHPTLHSEIVGWVTSGRLPEAPPAPLPFRVEVPVALWRDHEVAAVISIADTGPVDYLGKGLPFNGHRYVARRRSGRWVANEGAVGVQWPVAYGDRPVGDLPAVLGSGGGEEPLGAVAAYFAVGIAAFGVESVEVDLGGGDLVTVPVEPVSGAFVVRVPAMAWFAKPTLPHARPDERLYSTPDPTEVARRLDWLGVPRPNESA
jgi:hypothetical protein